MNILNKPILKTTISDYAKIMNEVAKKSKHVALDFAEDGIRSDIGIKEIRAIDPNYTVFAKNGRFTDKAKHNIVVEFMRNGIRSNQGYKDTTTKEYINMILNQINKTEKDVDYYI